MGYKVLFNKIIISISSQAAKFANISNTYQPRLRLAVMGLGEPRLNSCCEVRSYVVFGDYLVLPVGVSSWEVPRFLTFNPCCCPLR